MDLTMLSTIFLVFVMLILSCIILCIWPLISNMFSEQRTRNALKEVLADLEGTLISDITLPLNASQTTQIDHIFISTKGIFIIEEKNYTAANASRYALRRCTPGGISWRAASS